MKLTKEQLQEFEEKKSGLEDRIKRGFKWPARIDYNKVKQSIFVKFSALEKEIGADAMNDTEKAAYLSYDCCSHSEDDFITRFWDYSARTPQGHKKELEHYKLCIRTLADFDNEQAYEDQKIPAERGKKIKDAASEGGKIRNKEFIKKHNPMKKAASEKAKKISKYHSIRQAATELADEFDADMSTVKRVCKKELAPLNANKRRK